MDRDPIDWAVIAATLANNHENMKWIYSGLTNNEQIRLNAMRAQLDSEHEDLEAAQFDDEMSTFGISGQPGNYDFTAVERFRRGGF